MIKIRRFNPGDENSIKELILQIMNTEFGEDASAYPTEDIEDLERSYGGLGEAFFVALDDEKIVGTVGIKKEDKRVALLRRLFVAAPYRQRQIGIKLIDQAIQFCHQVGYEEIVFKTTSRMERAIKVCQKQGFIQRAKIDLGQIQLLKFSLSIREGLKTRASGSKSKT